MTNKKSSRSATIDDCKVVVLRPPPSSADPFAGASHDPGTLALMSRALADASRQVATAILFGRVKDDEVVYRQMAARIMGAANLGERDLERLTLTALRVIDGWHLGRI